MALASLFFLAAGLALSFIPGARIGRRFRRAQLCQRYCQLLVWALELRVEADNPTAVRFDGRGGKLLVANHISYLDVVLIGAQAPTVFVTSREIEETPILGLFCRAAGCAFVERRRKTAVVQDLAAITELLAGGLDVMFFPEGSTSDGGAFLDFKSTLLESALRTRSKVIALCLRYSDVERVAWYGDMTFFPHFLGLIRSPAVTASLTVLGEMPLRVHRSRKKLMDDVRNRIAAAYFAV